VHQRDRKFTGEQTKMQSLQCAVKEAVNIYFKNMSPVKEVRRDSCFFPIFVFR